MTEIFRSALNFLTTGIDSSPTENATASSGNQRSFPLIWPWEGEVELRCLDDISPAYV